MTSGKMRAPMSATMDRAPPSAEPMAVPVVTIPLKDYTELLEAKARIDIIDARARRYSVPPRSPIQVDAEIANFFKERFGTERMEDIIRKCAGQFGVARTPSRTAAYAYWKRLREGGLDRSRDGNESDRTRRSVGQNEF